MAEKEASTQDKARAWIKKLFAGAKVAPGSASNKTLESVNDKLQEVIGRKLKGGS